MTHLAVGKHGYPQLETLLDDDKRQHKDRHRPFIHGALLAKALCIVRPLLFSVESGLSRHVLLYSGEGLSILIQCLYFPYARHSL